MSRKRSHRPPICRRALEAASSSARLWVPIAAATILFVAPAWAETISQALTTAYGRNPGLNEQRASLRASDEQVSSAKSGYRPTVTGSGQFGPSRLDLDTVVSSQGVSIRSHAFARQASVSVTEKLFDGNRTSNQVRQSESQVLAAREQLRLTELDTLQNGASAYMDVLRDTAIRELDANNVMVLEQQLRQTRDRYLQAEVTQTDLAQAQASLASARADLSSAASTLKSSMASYEQVIGVPPRRLEPARPVDALLPATLEQALDTAGAEHPDIQSALHSADSAQLQVEIAEADLYPSLNVNGQAFSAQDIYGLAQTRIFNASVSGQLSVPLYDGGQSFAGVRRAKEQLTQATIHVDTSVRANVVSTWNRAMADRDRMRSVKASIGAYETALKGVRVEARVGQRTTLDVLQAQQMLLQARVNLVSVQRDRVVDSYRLLASVGRLSAATLGLAVVSYDPTIHFDQVKDKWYGLRTPDGQ